MKSVLLVTPPRGGSHMVAQAIGATPFQPWMNNNTLWRERVGSVLGRIEDGPDRGWCHVPAYAPVVEKAKSEYRVIVVLRRDPRDVALSLANFVRTSVGRGGPVDYRIGSGLKLSELEFWERLTAIVANFDLLYGWFTPWCFERGMQFVHVRYEDFWLDRNRECRQLRDALINRGMTMESADVMVSLSQVKGYAFHHGEIDQWQNSFDRGAMDAMSGMRPLILDWGYE